jgi:hypothetical protein
VPDCHGRLTDGEGADLGFHGRLRQQPPRVPTLRAWPPSPSWTTTRPWPGQFEQLAAALARQLGDALLAIEHIGSTAVPGLAAKDIIDLQVTVGSLADADRLAPAFERAGYSGVALPAGVPYWSMAPPPMPTAERWKGAPRSRACLASAHRVGELGM